MGICKCEKRNVTNLFCFEHRVNVCQHCLIGDHPKCIVKSYLQWLKDSEYEPVCSICMQDFKDSPVEQCIRLQCFDLFHWNCLNKYCSSLPITTAPAGYECPVCQFPIIPAANKVDIISNRLNEFLASASWPSKIGISVLDSRDVGFMKEISEQRLLFHEPSVSDEIDATKAEPFSLLRPLLVIKNENRDSSKPLRNFYSNEKKYHRKPFFQWFGRLLKSTSDSRDATAFKRTKLLFVLAIVMISFIATWSLLSRIGSYVTEQDPDLDPRHNPNIHFK